MQVPPKSDTLAITILFAFKGELHAKRGPWLVDSLTKIAHNVQPWTPVHVLVWYQVPLSPNLTSTIHKLLNGSIEFLQLSHSEWEDGDPWFMKKEIRGQRDRLRWTEMGFSLEYRRMVRVRCRIPSMRHLALALELQSPLEPHTPLLPSLGFNKHERHVHSDACSTCRTAWASRSMMACRAMRCRRACG